MVNSFMFDSFMFDQSPYECRVEWGSRGAREAAERGDITVIVDVLSFSSTVATAVQAGAVVYPFPPPHEDARRFAASIGAEFVAGRAEAARTGGRSLSPLSLRGSENGERYVLSSLNGAVCAAAASKVPALLAGSLLNASAAAEALLVLRRSYPGAAITVVPCGEQWANPLPGEHTLRPGIEDYLAAGAIVAGVGGSMSPEAEVCAAAFNRCRGKLEELIWDCGSGRELRARGYEEDVRYCSLLNALDAVPLLSPEGCFVRMNSGQA